MPVWTMFTSASAAISAFEMIGFGKHKQTLLIEIIILVCPTFVHAAKIIKCFEPADEILIEISNRPIDYFGEPGV